MKNNHSDFSSEPKFTRYYQLNSVPEAMSLIEAECFDTPADTTTKTESNAKGIIFGLGMTATLILLSMVQLYRSLEVTPANLEFTQSRESSASNIEATNIPERKFNSLPTHQRMVGSADKIEILMLQDAITKSRF